MTEGIVKIYMSIVEPEDKGLLWLRPYLDKEGYELLFFGSTGWATLIPCCTSEYDEENTTEEPKNECDGLLELPNN